MREKCQWYDNNDSDDDHNNDDNKIKLMMVSNGKDEKKFKNLYNLTKCPYKNAHTKMPIIWSYL